jgi:hypothetical protein
MTCETRVHTGRSNAGDMEAAARLAGIPLDYSVSSVPAVLKWLLGMVGTVGRAKDESLPDWIKSSQPYRSDLFDFDDLSKDLILQGGFYLGETFIQSFQGLSWDTGEPGFVQENMPVVKGFQDGDEMSASWLSTTCSVGDWSTVEGFVTSKGRSNSGVLEQDQRVDA